MSRRRIATRAALAIAVESAIAISPTAVATPSISPPNILSAAWGLNNANACPTGEKGLDNIPVTFNWFINLATINATDFVITRADGSIATPTCALQFPPNEPNEIQTVNLIGNFGDPDGVGPNTVTVVGEIEGCPPLASKWRPITSGLTQTIVQIEAGPDLSDAWRLTPAMLNGDKNACTVGRTFVRVVWSNGMTAYPGGTEVGDAAVKFYRALFTRPNGTIINVRPLAVADLADHSTTAMDDNMHDACLLRFPLERCSVKFESAATSCRIPTVTPTWCNA